MERLTEKQNDKLFLVKQDNGEFIPCYWDEDNFRAIEKLNAYENLEEQGLLVRLPCKVGDTIYKVNKASKKISEHKILKFEIDISDIDSFTMQIWFENYDFSFWHYFGKTVFLTREEAEKKLEELRNGKV